MKSYLVLLLSVAFACGHQDTGVDAGVCPYDHPQVCGLETDAGQTCCLQKGEAQCVVGPTGPSCCPMDGTHVSCNGVICCDLAQGACAIEAFATPGTTGDVCCPSADNCQGTCCNAGTVCDPKVGKCVCPDGGTCGN